MARAIGLLVWGVSATMIPSYPSIEPIYISVEEEEDLQLSFSLTGISACAFTVFAPLGSQGLSAECLNGRN